MPVRQLLLFTPMQLGEVLRATRQSRKLTQSWLAGRLGLSQSRVSHLEQHPEELSFKQLLAWSAVLELELTIGSRGASENPDIQTDW